MRFACNKREERFIAQKVALFKFLVVFHFIINFLINVLRRNKNRNN